VTRVTERAKTQIPYVGPRPFNRDECDLFFGRNREVSELVSLVYSNKTTVLYAQSGAGKTSLLNAGLLPALKEEGFICLPGGRVGGADDRTHTREGAENVFASGLLASLQEEHVDTHDAWTIRQYLCWLRSKRGINPDTPLVLVIDQAEELLTYRPSRWKDRKGFFEQLLEAMESDQLLRVVLALREDFIAQMEPYLSVLPSEYRTGIRMECLRAGAAMEAIRRPLHGTGRHLANGVTEALVADLARVRAVGPVREVEEFEGEFIEPVHLQVVCSMLWQSLPEDTCTITWENVQKYGDVNDALVAFYDQAVADAAEGSRRMEHKIRRWIEEELITPSGTRGMVHRDAKTTGGLENALVDKLEDLHILRAEWRAGSRWYELPHDRFVEPVLLRAYRRFELKGVLDLYKQIAHEPLIVLGMLTYIASLITALASVSFAGRSNVPSILLMTASVGSLLFMTSGTWNFMRKRRAARKRVDRILRARSQVEGENSNTEKSGQS